MAPAARMTPAEFGAALRRTREAAGTALETIASRTKIPLRALAALEGGEFGKLPDRVFARMFLRQYAEVVGTRADEWLPRFEAAWQGFEESSHPALAVPPLPIRRRHIGPWVIGLALVAAGVAGVVLLGEKPAERAPVVLTPVPNTGAETTAAPNPLTKTGPHTEPAPLSVAPVGAETTSAAPTVAVTGPEKPAAAPAPGVLVVRTGTNPCWVEVRVAGGKATSRLLPGGSTWEVAAGGREVDLVLGDAGAVTVEYLGEERRPVGRAGAVARIHLDGSPAAAPPR